MDVVKIVQLNKDGIVFLPPPSNPFAPNQHLLDQNRHRVQETALQSVEMELKRETKFVMMGIGWMMMGVRRLAPSKKGLRAELKGVCLCAGVHVETLNMILGRNVMMGTVQMEMAAPPLARRKKVGGARNGGKVHVKK